MKKFIRKNKEKVILGYILVCILYAVIQFIRPHPAQYAALYTMKAVVIHMFIMLFAGMAMYPVVFGKEKGKKEKGKSTYKGKYRNKLYTFYVKYKHVIGLLIVVGIVGYLSLVVYRSDIRVAMNGTKDCTVQKIADGSIKIKKNTKEITQEFTLEEDLIGLSVGFFMDHPIDQRQGSVHATILRNGTEIVGDYYIQMSEITNGFWWKMMFQEKEYAKNNSEYVLKLEFPQDISEYGLSLAVSDTGSKVTINGKETGKYSLALNGHKDLNLFIRPYFLGICIAILLLSVLLYVMLFIKKVDISVCAFVAVLLLGMIYGFFITPYMVPDEQAHIDMAYRYADIMMGTGNTEDGRCLKRIGDGEKQFVSDPSVDNYRVVYETIGHRMSKEQTEIKDVAASGNTGAYLFMHLPGAVGIVIARSLGLGTTQMLYLGRFMGLLLFAVAVFLGIRRIPFGKAVVFTLAILPITLQQVNSFSYDSVLFSSVLVFACYILGMTYDNKSISEIDLLLVCVLGIGIIYCKSGAYTPVCFSYLLIPAKKFANRKEHATFTLGLGFTYILAFLAKNIKVVNTGAEVTNKVMGIESAMTIPNYSVDYLLSHPITFFDVINNTVLDKTDFYVQSMLGQHLGWIQIEVANVIVISFSICLFLSALRPRGEEQYIEVSHKWWIICVTVASAALVLLGMLISWTPVTYVSVEGVQGRYFYPLLFFGLFVLRNSKVILSRNIDRELMFAGFSITTVGAYFFMHAVL